MNWFKVYWLDWHKHLLNKIWTVNYCHNVELLWHRGVYCLNWFKVYWPDWHKDLLHKNWDYCYNTRLLWCRGILAGDYGLWSCGRLTSSLRLARIWFSVHVLEKQKSRVMLPVSNWIGCRSVSRICGTMFAVCFQPLGSYIVI